MKVLVEAVWDGEAGVWVATAADDKIGLVAEAAAIERLQLKLALMVPDLLGGDGPYEIELVARRTQTVAA